MHKSHKVGKTRGSFEIECDCHYSNVIEFGWNIDIFLNLFQLSTKQKRLKCCHFSHFTNIVLSGVFD